MTPNELRQYEKRSDWIAVTIFVSGCVLWALLLFFYIPIANGQELGAATLDWLAPTQNEDGTPLTDLDGFKIKYGNDQGGPYPTEIDIPNENLTTYIVENLAPGDYYFVSTAYNTTGTESQNSNEATKFIPQPPGPLIVSEDTVYTVVKQTDEFVLIPVGTIPLGTPCDDAQSVNQHNVVPSGQVTPFGNVVPIVVVAKCEN